MNFLGGLKNKITTIYKGKENADEGHTYQDGTNLDYEDLTHTLSVIQDENKILKSKVRVLENSVFGTSDGTLDGASKFGKVFQELKSSFIFNTSNKSSFEDAKSELSEFKHFLLDNMLFYNNVDEDDVDYLNNIQISDGDWKKNRDLIIFKQKVLEKNYSEMFKNILASRELNKLVGDTTYTSNVSVNRGNTEKENSSNYSDEVKSKKQSVSSMNQFKRPISLNKKSEVETGPSELENILLGDMINKNVDRSSVVNDLDEKKVVTPMNVNMNVQTPVNISSYTNDRISSISEIKKQDKNETESSKLNKILNIEDEEDFDISSVLKKGNKNVKEKEVLSNNITFPFAESISSPNKSLPNIVTSNGSGKITTAKVSLGSTKKEEEDPTSNLLSSLLLGDDNPKSRVSLQNSLNKNFNTNFSIKKTTSTDNSSKTNTTSANPKHAKYAWDEEDL